MNVSEPVKNVEPLSHDDLGGGGNQRVVHGLDERGFVTTVTPWSTQTRVPPVGVPHAHLSVAVVSLLEGVGGYEPSIPQLCSSERMMLQPGTNGIHTC